MHMPFTGLTEEKVLIAAMHGEKEWIPGALAALFGIMTALGNFFIAIYFKEELGFSGMQIGIIFALQAITGVLASFPAGFSNDRLESRTLVAASLVVMAISYVFLGSQKMFLWVAMAFFFWTLANAVFRMSLDLQVLKSNEGGQTGTRVGLYQLCRFLGLGAGTLISGVLIHRFDFGRCLLFCAVGCLFMLFLVRPLSPTKVAAVRLTDYKGDLGSPRVWLFAGWGASLLQYAALLSADGAAQDEVDAEGFFLLATCSAPGPPCGSTYGVAVIGPRLREFTSLRGYIVAGLVASGIGHIGMVTHIVPLSAAFRGLHGVGDGIVTMIQYVGVARLFSLERIGGNNGLITTVLMLGFIVGSLIYGPLGEHLGYSQTLWISGALTLLLALPFCFMRNQAMDGLSTSMRREAADAK